MEVKNIQKINDLAKELLKHNMASNSDDAIVKATQMINGTKKSEATSTINTNSTNQYQEVAKPNEFEASKLRKIEYNIGENSTKISQIFSKMNEMIKEINMMQNTINNLKSENESLKKKIASPIAQQVNSDQTQLKEAPKQQAHPRSGNFSSEDVAIDKMFYFGNK